MAKSSRKSAEQGIELVPDAWERFEKFIREIVKAGPQPKKRPKAKKKREADHDKRGR